MAEPTPFELGPTVTCHAWNAKYTECAVCFGNNELVIFKVRLTPGEKWEKVDTLRRHEEVIAGVDWCHKNNRIVTCSWDRNAYVWEQVDGQWQPALVILRLERAALCVSWSFSGLKFAVGSGSRSVSICYYDPDNRWWVSKAIKKKHSSSVTSVAWHPNNALLATTSTDGKCRIFCVPLRSVDGTAPAAEAGGFSIGKFGEQLLQLDLAFGWTFGATWSPGGTNLAFVAHDSTIHFASNVGPNLTIHSLSLSSLPLRDAAFLSDRLLVAAGFDGNPMLFAADAEGKWTLLRYLDESQAPGLPSSRSLRASSADGAAGATSLGGGLGLGAPAKGSVHSDAIVRIRAMGLTTDGVVEMFSTCGFDGKVVIWDVSGLRLASTLKLV